MDPEDFDDGEKRGKSNLDVTCVTWALGKVHQFFRYTCRWVCKQITFSRRMFVLVSLFNVSGVIFLLAYIQIISLVSCFLLHQCFLPSWHLKPLPSQGWTNGWSLWSYSSGSAASDEFSDRFFINVVRNSWFWSLGLHKIPFMWDFDIFTQIPVYKKLNNEVVDKVICQVYICVLTDPM